MAVITAILKSLYEFVCNRALELCDDKLLHCRQRGPVLCSPASVAEFFWEPACSQSIARVSPNQCHLAGFVMSH